MGAVDVKFKFFVDSFSYLSSDSLSLIFILPQLTLSTNTPQTHPNPSSNLVV